MFRYVLRWITIWILIFVALCICSIIANWELLVYYLTDLFGDFFINLVVYGSVVVIGGGILLGHSAASDSPVYRDDFFH